MRQYQTISFSALPKFREEIANMAKEEGMTLSEFIREALRRQIELKKFRQAQERFTGRARELGIEDEDDVERIVDEIRTGK